MTTRAARLVLALSGAVRLTGAAVCVLVSTGAGRPFSPSIVPWAVFPIVWWAVGASIVVQSPGHRRDRAANLSSRLAATGPGFTEIARFVTISER